MKSFISKIYQCEKERNAIAHAFLWAAIFLAVAWFTRGSENAHTLLIILISASTVTFLYSAQSDNKSG